MPPAVSDPPPAPGQTRNGAAQFSPTPRPTRPRFVARRSAHGGLVLERNTLRLSLCMIVRDNEQTIGPCLQSIRPYVDEIVVVDTGSTDRTPDLCREHGARMFHFPWSDDFSAARNESLHHARGEWIFWMDSDDTIPEACGRKLRALVNGTHDEHVLGYILQVHCPGAGEEGRLDVTAVDHVKLIRNHPDLRFEGRIHEQLLPAIRRAEGDVQWTDLHVVHSGSDHSVDGRRRKLERDLRILQRELLEKPDHPFVLFNLGMTYADDRKYDEAIQYLSRSIALSKPEESHLRKAYSLLVNAFHQSDRQDEAWSSCQAGKRLFPDDKELLFRSAMLQHHMGRLRDAEHTYLRVLEAPEERHFTSVDQGLSTYKARHNLALVYQEMGCLGQAEAQWLLVVQEVPAYRPGWRGLADVLLKQGRLPDAEKLANQLKSRPALHSEGRLVQAKLYEKQGQVSLARRELEAAREESPDDLEVIRELCRLLFEYVNPVEAEPALRQVLDRDPSDAAAHHNLGTVHFCRKRYGEAVRSYERSLELRPKSPGTWLQLGHALRASGRLVEAVRVWEEANGLWPGHRELVAALKTVQSAARKEKVTATKIDEGR